MQMLQCSALHQSLLYMCLCVGCDTVKHTIYMYVAVNFRLISWGATFRYCQMC